MDGRTTPVTTSTTSQASTVTLLTVLVAAGRARIATCLWGMPGIGKSALVHAIGHAEQMPVETVLGSIREPSDIVGLPIVTDDGVRLDPPTWAKRLAMTGRGIAFLDELSTSAPAVQAAMLGVVLDRRVGDLDLPDDVWVVAAANPPEVAADGWDLTPPMANRLLHIDYPLSTDTWIDGMTTGFVVPAPGRVHEPDRTRTAISRAVVASFVRTRPDLLHQLPTDPATTGRAWPSPRTWTMTADLLALLPDDDRDAALLAAAGLVGQGAAAEFLAWRATSDLPDPADVIADPQSVDWTSLDPSRTWAVLTGVVSYSVGRATIDAWRAAWVPLAVAAEHGKADVAAACVRTLLTARPARAAIPREAKAFTAVLTEAGLMGGAR